MALNPGNIAFFLSVFIFKLLARNIPCKYMSSIMLTSLQLGEYLVFVKLEAIYSSILINKSCVKLCSVEINLKNVQAPCWLF